MNLVDTPTPAEIGRLVERFSRSRALEDLWPGTTAAQVVQARAAVYDVCKRVVRTSDGEVAAHPLFHDEAHARVLSAVAWSMGVGPLLGFWVAQGRVSAGERTHAALQTQLVNNRAFMARVEHEVMAVLDALLGFGVVPAVFKGFHAAHAYWDDPGVRPMADVDIVVPRGRVADVERVLLELGFVAQTPYRANPYARHWAPRDQPQTIHSVERPDARNPWRLDVHDSFDAEIREVDWARLDDLAALRPFEWNGRQLTAPAQPLQLALLCCHMAKELDSYRLLRTIEVERVIRADRSASALDWDQFLSACERAGVSRFVYPTLALVDQLSPGTVDSVVLRQAAQRAGSILRTVMRRLHPAGGAPKKDVVATLMWARSLRQLLRAVGRRLVRRGDRDRFRRWFRELRDGGIVVRRAKE